MNNNSVSTLNLFVLQGLVCGVSYNKAFSKASQSSQFTNMWDSSVETKQLVWTGAILLEFGHVCHQRKSVGETN